jgi:hypothetical protein
VNVRFARLLAVAALTVGAGVASAPALGAPCPLSQYEIPSSTLLFVDCGYHLGVGSGTLGATSAQVVCLGTCTTPERTGVYYNWATGSLCVKVYNGSWTAIGGTGC